MQVDSLFRMVRTVKRSSVGITLLVEDGKLDLDKSVGTYLTFRMKGGTRLHSPSPDAHQWHSHLPLFFTPLIQRSHLILGSRFRQVNHLPPFRSRACGKDLFLQQRLLQHTGCDHRRGDRFLQATSDERIYRPLGMFDSCNHESDADHNRMSTVFRSQRDGTWTAGWKPGDAPDWPFPCGSEAWCPVHVTTHCFATCSSTRGARDRQILHIDSVKEMTNPQAKYFEAANHYGLGWTVTAPGGTFSHSGLDGTYVW